MTAVGWSKAMNRIRVKRTMMASWKMKHGRPGSVNPRQLARQRVVNDVLITRYRDSNEDRGSDNPIARNGLKATAARP